LLSTIGYGALLLLFLVVIKAEDIQYQFNLAFQVYEEQGA
jgi:hypothetical protein